MTEYEKLMLRAQIAILHQLNLIPKNRPVGGDEVQLYAYEREGRKSLIRDIRRATEAP